MRKLLSQTIMLGFVVMGSYSSGCKSLKEWQSGEAFQLPALGCQSESRFLLCRDYLSDESIRLVFPRKKAQEVAEVRYQNCEGHISGKIFFAYTSEDFTCKQQTDTGNRAPAGTETPERYLGNR